MGLRRGLAIFLLLTLGVGALIICSSINKHTLMVFSDFQKINLLYILMMVFIAWSCDSMRFCMTARAMGYKIPFVRGLVLTWLHYFGCAITPMQVGGGPFQVYVLYRSGVPVGSGIAITLIRTLFSTFLLSIAAPAAFILVPELYLGGMLIRGVFYYVITLSIVMWSFFILSVIKAVWIKRFCCWVLVKLKKFKFFRKIRVIYLCRLICSEIDSYSQNVKRMLGQGFPWFVGAFLISVCHLFALFSVLPLLMNAVKMSVNYFHVVLAQAMFMFILYFIPTPGASGVAEGGGAAIFALLMPENVAGVMAIMCRFFTEYLAIFMGCIVAIRMVGWGTAERILSSRQNEVIEVIEEEERKVKRNG